MSSLSDRLKRELKRRIIEPETLDFKAGLARGTTAEIIGGAVADDPVVVQVAIAVDQRPSLLEHGVEDPASLWNDAEMRRATGLNIVWQTAMDHSLTPQQGRRLFDKMFLDGGRNRHHRGFTRDAAEKASHDLFPSSSVEPQNPEFRVGTDDPFDDDWTGAE